MQEEMKICISLQSLPALWHTQFFSWREGGMGIPMLCSYLSLFLAVQHLVFFCVLFAQMGLEWFSGPGGYLAALHSWTHLGTYPHFSMSRMGVVTTKPLHVDHPLTLKHH